VEAQYGVEYQNPVAISMRAIELQAVQQLMNFVAPFAQIDPNILRRFDLGGLVEAGAEILRTPVKILKSEEQFQEEMQREQQQQQQMAMLQQQQQQAQVAATGTEAMENVANASQAGLS